MKTSTLLSQNAHNELAQESDTATAWLLRAGWINQASSGIYNYLTLGQLALQRLENSIRKQMLQADFQEVRLTCLQTKQLWDTTGRWDQYGENLFHVGKEHCLAATHEEMITSVVKNLDYRTELDVFQIGNKYRQESRAKAGLIRSREFVMKDAYSFRHTKEGVDEVYNRMYQVYKTFLEGLGFNLYIKEAETGEIGGSKSHEFLIECELGEDIIEGKKYLEVAHIFNLGTKYSEAFNLTHQGQLIEMSCYGIGISRVLAAYVQLNTQKHMLKTSASIYSVDYYLVVDNTSEELALQLYTSLKGKGYTVLLDNSKQSLGKQLMQSELLGVQKRIVLSKRGSVNGYEVFNFTKQVLTKHSEEELISIS